MSYICYIFALIIICIQWILICPTRGTFCPLFFFSFWVYLERLVRSLDYLPFCVTVPQSRGHRPLKDYGAGVLARGGINSISWEDTRFSWSVFLPEAWLKHFFLQSSPYGILIGGFRIVFGIEGEITFWEPGVHWFDFLAILEPIMW